MTRRLVAVLLDPRSASSPPPGIDPQTWRAALAEDVLELAASLAGVDAGVVTGPEDAAFAAGLVWPGVTLLTVEEPTVYAGLVAASAAGYEEAALLAADVPDLPGLHVGKLFRGLGGHPVALADNGSAGGGVAIAARLPAPPWLAPVNLDTVSVDSLRARAGVPRSAIATPGWRRLRGPADLHRLDPGLEGWEATRALLSGANR